MCLSLIQVEDVTASNDEVDAPPDVETSKNSGRDKSSAVGGDELWSDDDQKINTVSRCYVKVNEPLRQSPATTSHRFVQV